MTLNIIKISKRSRNNICYFFVLRKDLRVIEVLGFMYKPVTFGNHKNLGVVFLNMSQIKYWLSLKIVKIPLWFNKFILPFRAIHSFSNFVSNNVKLHNELTSRSSVLDFANLLNKEPSRLFYKHSFILRLWLNVFFCKRASSLKSNAVIYQKKI